MAGFVVAMITMSAIIAGYEAIARLIHPQQIEHVGLGSWSR